MKSLKKAAHDFKFIIGYTTRRHLCLDLDNTTKLKTIKLATMIMRQYPEVGDCLLVSSSHKNLVLDIRYSRRGKPWQYRQSDGYHLVFNNIVGYNKCCRIIAVLAALGALNADYGRIRRWRGDMTLRISPTAALVGLKPSPVPVTRIYNTWTERADGMIDTYCRLLSLVAHAFNLDLNPENEADHESNGCNNRAENLAVQLGKQCYNLKDCQTPNANSG